jgi:amidase
LDDVIKENQLDAICGLTMGPACIDNIYGDRWGDVFSQLLQLQAAIHISALRKVYELPIGFSFFGTAYSEQLIGLAYAFEQASNNRIKPSFKKSFYRNT